MKACTGPEKEGESGVVFRRQEAGSVKHQQQYLFEFVKNVAVIMRHSQHCASGLVAHFSALLLVSQGTLVG